MLLLAMMGLCLPFGDILYCDHMHCPLIMGVVEEC